MMSVFETVCDVLAEYFGVQADEMSLETELEMDLNADAADLAEIASALEEAFELPGLDAGRLERMATVEDLCEYISDEVGA